MATEISLDCVHFKVGWGVPHNLLIVDIEPKGSLVKVISAN